MIMLENFWIIILFPLAAFIGLALYGKSLTQKLVAVIGSAPSFISALLIIFIGSRFISGDQTNVNAYLWQWIEINEFSVDIAFQLDALSLVFSFIITFVGALILLYSTDFMRKEDGYARFFAYMNLFIASMLILVLADNLLLLYLGWEGVGLCSFLLIGFWYKDQKNGFAAQKAFIVTRIGDTAMAIGLFLLILEFGTLNIAEILDQAPKVWESGNGTARLAAFLLLGGAVGKSAQLPLQTWLPDAMAGPSPVSALIHAATMVTAGVYLIARTHVIFTLSPLAMQTVALIGGITLLLAGFSALTQRDIKKVLAYSTISQIGYMFLALGVGAWSAAIFHFAIHAFFKALLFLGAGSLILALNHEHDMFKMGGLTRKMPVTFWTFLIAAASLAALPLITAGFYSKDLILWRVFSSPQGGFNLWLMGAVGALITSLYTFRMVFVTFFGKTRLEPTQLPGWRIKATLVILAFFSFAGGFIELPHNLGHFTVFSDFITETLPEVSTTGVAISETALQLITGVLTIAALGFTYWFFVKKQGHAEDIQKDWNLPLQGLLRSGWGFDKIYSTLIVKPFVFISKLNRNDIFDRINRGIENLMVKSHSALSNTQNGNLRWYMAAITFGAVLIVTIMIMI